VIEAAVLVVAAYLVGSLPFGLILAKTLRGVDIRQHGSGNIGATNVFRVLGPAYGLTCLVLDTTKGLAPVLVAKSLLPQMPAVHVLVAAATVIGHSASIFLKFKGGKGVATSLGVLFALDWRLALLAIATWGVVLGLSGYVSLASITAAVGAVVYAGLLGLPRSYLLLFAVMASVIVARHTGNIDRLLKGSESRMWGKHTNSGQGPAKQ